MICNKRHKTRLKQNSEFAATPLRIVTATVLFDGHDAAINIIRRILQQKGCEIIHLGHNRSVNEIVQTAIQEDADAIAVNSYQGSHRHFFRYLLKELKKNKAGDIQIFAGGGGTITEKEARQLEQEGINKIYTSHDSNNLSLDELGDDLIARCRKWQLLNRKKEHLFDAKKAYLTDYQLARVITLLETDNRVKTEKSKKTNTLVLGITGTGGSGKSTLIDELIHHVLDQTEAKKKPYRIAMLAIDPTRQKSGGALLGDRIRINSQPHPRLFIRSLATRIANRSLTPHLQPIINVLKHQGFNLIMIETSGIGQSDASIIPFCDKSVYVMTRDYGAPGQLEKLEMLDRADFIVLNKFDQQGSEDALKDIKKQWQRNHQQFNLKPAAIPVFPMISSHFNDPGVYEFSQTISQLIFKTSKVEADTVIKPERMISFKSIIPANKENYLAEIVQQAKALKKHNKQQCHSAEKAYCYLQSLQRLLPENQQDSMPLKLTINVKKKAAAVETADKNQSCTAKKTINQLKEAYNKQIDQLSAESKQLLSEWPAQKKTYQHSHNDDTTGHQSKVPNNVFTSLSQLDLPLVALPDYSNWGNILSYCLNENLPGSFPYTAGVFPFRNPAEEPTRLFAGEGTPENTNRRFFFLIKDQKSIRLSTAFDPITLYGKDPSITQDIYGCIGMSGVSVATLDDMKILYSGIDLNAPQTSVSMTINGPAAIIMAWFINTAIDQRIEQFLHKQGLWKQSQKLLKKLFKDRQRPEYHGHLPERHNGLGLGLLGISGQQLITNNLISKKCYKKLTAETLHHIRGTLQADILKEEMAQNECLFSLEFGLQLMADMQQYFIQHQVTHFYPVSVSGYHIAEAGANPVTQLAFTLANGFTLVEYYLARGMAIDDFAAKMSFFFSNGMDPEYAVIGRVARRIWARAMRYYYHANSTSQKLKYHIQTSGRSLHAQAIELNDIRTTLQAQYALNDNCNSLHTNAYDEAVTTPTESSVRRALAIQLIIQRELGLSQNQNPLQGSYLIQDLTNKVEAAVYDEFEQLSARGGVLGAIETFYQRGKIQDESLFYEQQNKSGHLPIIGVNTFISSSIEKQKHDKKSHTKNHSKNKLTRSNNKQKQQQIKSLKLFKENHKGKIKSALLQLDKAIKQQQNSFTVLVDIAGDCTLEQLTNVLTQSGGIFRRKM